MIGKTIGFIITKKAAATYTLSVSVDEGIDYYVIKRTQSTTGTIGEQLYDGSTIYEGDVLSIAVYAKYGYRENSYPSTITVEGNSSFYFTSYKIPIYGSKMTSITTSSYVSTGSWAGLYWGNNAVDLPEGATVNNVYFDDSSGELMHTNYDWSGEYLIVEGYGMYYNHTYNVTIGYTYYVT